MNTPRSPRNRWLALLYCFIALALPLVAQSQVGVRAGPMVGYGEMTEVMLWVQATGPAEVQYRYWIQGDKKKTWMSKKTKVTGETDCIAHTCITGLEAGRKFEYELLINGSVVKRPYRLMFQTQPLWQWRTDPPNFTIAIGSCAYINDLLADRSGNPYGENYEVFTAIAEQKPDLMLWLGDNTYYRAVDWSSASHMRYRYSHTRSLPEMQPLLGASHNYAIWDDHDYGPDDSDRRYRMRGAALETFKLFWANHTYGTEELPGVFGRFEWGDVEFFLLDDRYHRSPNAMPDDASKTMFGKEQLQWLKESLVSSRAPFKIVANGNQMLTAHRFESFANYTFEQRELLRWIKEQRITGVVFVSGDRHFTQLNCLRDPLFYPLYDFTSSPITGGLFTTLREDESAIGVRGTFVNDVRNFGLLRFDGPRTDRRLTMECYDKDGKLRWSHVVKASELRPPSEK